MDYAAAAEALIRRKLLEGIYDKMSDEEKRLFVRMTMENRSHAEIMQALQQQSMQIQDLRRRQQTFGEDLTSNVLGNVIYGGALWLARRLLG